MWGNFSDWCRYSSSLPVLAIWAAAPVTLWTAGIQLFAPGHKIDFLLIGLPYLCWSGHRKSKEQQQEWDRWLWWQGGVYPAIREVIRPASGSWSSKSWMPSSSWMLAAPDWTASSWQREYWGTTEKVKPTASVWTGQLKDTPTAGPCITGHIGVVILMA